MHSHIPHTVLKHHLSDGYCNPQIKNKHLSKRPSSNDKKIPDGSAYDRPGIVRLIRRRITAKPRGC